MFVSQHSRRIFSCGFFLLVVAQVIEVKFEKLDLEPDTYCRYDYVALFNGGENDNSRRIGKFCGDRAPGYDRRDPRCFSKNRSQTLF